MEQNGSEQNGTEWNETEWNKSNRMKQNETETKWIKMKQNHKTEQNVTFSSS